MPEIICRLIRLMGLGQYGNVLSLGAKSEDALMLEESGNGLFAFVPLSFSHSHHQTFPRGIIYNR